MRVIKAQGNIAGNTNNETNELKMTIKFTVKKQVKRVAKRIVTTAFYFKLSKYCLSVLIIVACILLVKPSYLYAKSVIAQVLLNHAWYKSQQLDDDFLPWQWSDSYPIAKLSYPKSNQSWIVLSGMTGRAMAFAPSWLEDSAGPNQYGNTIISAHNDSHFSVLESAEIGDQFLLEDKSGEVLSYRIASIDIVSEKDVSPYQFEDETMITLITCYPFQATNLSKTERLVVQAFKDIF